VGSRNQDGLGSGGEKSGGEKTAAVEREAEKALVGDVDERGRDVRDGKQTGGDGAGEEQRLDRGILRRGSQGERGDSGAGKEGREENAVARRGELGEKTGGGAGSCRKDIRDEGIEGREAGAGGISGDIGVIRGIGGNSGGGGVAILAAEIGGVEESGAGGVELFDEAVLKAPGGWGLDDGRGGDGKGCAEDASGQEDGVGGGGEAVTVARPLPTYDKKISFKFWLNLPMKTLEVPEDGDGMAAPEVVLRSPVVEVPVT
jgi:hypothetical protein